MSAFIKSKGVEHNIWAPDDKREFGRRGNGAFQSGNIFRAARNFIDTLHARENHAAVARFLDVLQPTSAAAAAFAAGSFFP
jgi:hypothetical protein